VETSQNQVILVFIGRWNWFRYH